MEKNNNKILETVGISKSFGKVQANQNINFFLNKGEILSILGENGAGKSTLMNILYGLYTPDEGEIYLDGKKVEFKTSNDSIKHGLGMVHQHFKLVENLSVTQNIILGQEPTNKFGIDYAKAKKIVKNLSDTYQLEVNPDSIIQDLPVGIQQRVEIIKVLYRNAKVLILDEPTAVLTPQEVISFFDVVRRLKNSGVSVIIITHKLKEIMYLSNRVYILRRGKITDVFDTDKVNPEQLASSMVGREVVLTKKYIAGHPKESTVLELKEVSLSDDKHYELLKNLSLKVRPGEILGIAGVEGNGQYELAQVIMGLSKIKSGKIIHDGKDISDLTIRERIARGIGYVPNDRQKAGLIMPFSIEENILIGNHYDNQFVHKGIISKEHLKAKTDSLINDFKIKVENSLTPVKNLSGGNQQKVILSREFDREPNFLLVSQPTRGLDVGAIEYIHERLIQMRDRNVGMILISMELDEILTLSDRILVMFDGQIIKEFSHDEATEDEIGFYMTGGFNE